MIWYYYIRFQGKNQLKLRIPAISLLKTVSIKRRENTENKSGMQVYSFMEYFEEEFIEDLPEDEEDFDLEEED